MRFLPPDEDVKLYVEGFSGDLLGRKKVSESLSDVLERIEDPLVVALDGRWGTGKSYFLKRWVGEHALNVDHRAIPVYFDAFAHDYLSDPLIGLVGALSERIPKEAQPKLQQLKRVALGFAKPSAKLLIALATFGATNALNEMGDVIAGTAKTEAEKAMDNFWRREEGRQTAMLEFRTAVEALTAPNGGKEATPLIFVIDELDRCRPDYALEILEVIKHFFAVPHVHFVLGVNLKALENSVKARYGAEIDATAYLQKFLSFSISLPDHIGDNARTPSVFAYLTHLAKEMHTPGHILSEIHTQLNVLTRCNHISIRDVGKIMSVVSLLPKEAQSNNDTSGDLMVAITLIITRVIQPELFAKFRDASISDEELVSFMGATIDIIDQNRNGGEHNPDYIHEVAVRYKLWTFIREDGHLVDRDDRGWVARLFDPFGQPNSVKKIPQRIYEDWLSVFKLS